MDATARTLLIFAYGLGARRARMEQKAPTAVEWMKPQEASFIALSGTKRFADLVLILNNVLGKAKNTERWLLGNTMTGSKRAGD